MLLTRLPSDSTSPPPAHAPRSPGRVLVVDGVEAQRYAVVQALRAEGFEVLECADGASALAIACSEALDAVVLDVGLPAMDGFEVCRRLKADRSALVPVLHLSSARTSSESRALGLDAGADSYLTHPFDPNELRAAVSALVRLKRQTAEQVAGAAINSLLLDALDALGDHVALLGHDGVVLAVNRAWNEFGVANGYADSGTGLGISYLEVCADAGTDSGDARRCASQLRALLRGEIESFEMDYPCHSPTEERWFCLTIRRIGNDSPVAAIATHRNRTREVLAARAETAAYVTAEADRRRLEATLDALPVGVWIANAGGEITHSNPSAARIWGGSAPHAGTIPGYAVDRARRVDTGEPVQAADWALARALTTGETVMDQLVEIDRFDGRTAFVLTTAAPMRDGDGRIIGAVVAGIDVSDQQAAARERERLVALVAAESSRLAKIFEQAPSFLSVLRGPDHVFERVNPAYLQLVGHRDLIGLPLRDALPEIVDQGFIAILDRVRATGEPMVFSHMAVDLERVEGEPRERRYVDLVYQRLDDADGDYAIVAHGVDVTDSVSAAEELQRSEQRLRDQFAKLPVATYLWEQAGDDFVLLDLNEAAMRAFPAHGAASIGQTTRTLFPGIESTTRELARSLRENVVVRASIELDADAPTGPRHFDITIGPQRPDRVLLHAVDTTARTELEAQLRQAQKMDAVGRLAGGVAHDFNNLLTVIGAHSSFLLESLDASDPQREDAEAIHQAGVRAAGLTRQLLAFSRKQILKPAMLDLNVIVEETRKMVERLLGEDIAITVRLARDLGRVVADAGQLDQVLVNLAVNARDAMPAGGRLTITTRNETISAGMVGARRVIPPGEYALLEVSDTGVGMEPSVQARLFEPFFTTKPVGKGTGLGLATVYGVVKQSAGYILVESEPGQGTTFRVYLPLVSAAADGDEELRVAVGAAVRGVETILLIEDEPAVREIAQRVLKRQGYVVLMAGSGAEALAISAAFMSPIHLVLSDAVMPGMSGVEVVRRLREQRPALKMLFMSGYTDDEIVRRGIISSSMPFVEKPFAPADFSRAVRDALDS